MRTNDNTVDPTAGAVGLALAAFCRLARRRSRSRGRSRSYFVDVEGGQSTLIVSPSGQSLLIDTGWRGFEGRDADRIVQAAKAAKVKQIDYLLITHYHRDHVGGVPQLADQMKIVNFLDHGPNTEDSKGNQGRLHRLREGHPARRAHGAEAGRHGSDQRALGKSADGGRRNISRRRWRAPANRILTARPRPSAKPIPPRTPNRSGVLVTFEKFRFLDMGDLDVEQGAGADVPEQSHRDGGCAAGVASRAESIEFSGVGGRGASARGDHEQRRAQGRQPGRMADREGFAGLGRPVAAALCRATAAKNTTSRTRS